MTRTRLSLFYVAGYLFPTGFALLFAPRAAMKVLLSNGEYGDVMPRVVGMFLVGLGIVVTEIIRRRAEAMYVPTILARAWFCAGFVGIWWLSRDPMFLVMLGVVGLGLAMTATCAAMEKRRTG